mmetsp:Transcript_28844/g.75673  ORF Transcript_28844/g.75673 Transcript_28844/m.75673 type:complete len:86 (-) Transcript_28844:283-540(-)
MSARYAIEKFRFGVYVFFPITLFYYFNRPDFYDKHIMPSIPQFYPTEGVNMELPHTREGNRALLEKLKQDHRKSQETGAPESAAN